MSALTHVDPLWGPKAERLLAAYRADVAAGKIKGAPRLVRVNATAITIRFGFAWVPAWAVRAAIAGCDEKTPNLNPDDYVEGADLGTAAKAEWEKKYGSGQSARKNARGSNRLGAVPRSA